MMWSNEIDPFPAQWQRHLMDEGLIPAAEVDERSILDVTPAQLRGYRQAHFFSGVSVWPLALRLAGWPDDREVWTGSCPCQPFSAAGKREGAADERHLWPAWHWLIEQCRPDVVLGEQVASADGLAWLDLVSSDLDGAGYTLGVVDTCAAGFGAPHIRQRLYWVAIPERTGLERFAGHVNDWREPRRLGSVARGSIAAECTAGGLADVHGAGRGIERGAWVQRPEVHDPDGRGAGGGMADADEHASGQGRALVGGRHPRGNAHQGAGLGSDGISGLRPGPTNGLWRDADWLLCRDDRWRPVRPGSFPLAHGSPGGMVPLCADCRRKKGPLNVSLPQLLRVVGRDEGRKPAKVLLHGLPIRSQDERAEQQEYREAAGAATEAREPMRTLRELGKASAAPQRREPVEQRCRKHSGSLSDVPSQGSFKATADVDLRGMWDSVSRHFTSKQEQDLQCVVCGGMGADVRLKAVEQSRVGRLRGYGNALCLAQAQAFVETVMEALA